MAQLATKDQEEEEDKEVEFIIDTEGDLLVRAVGNRKGKGATETKATRRGRLHPFGSRRPLTTYKLVAGKGERGVAQMRTPHPRPPTMIQGRN